VGFTYFARRVVGTLPPLFGVLLLTFLIVHAVPGDPALLLAGEEASVERVQEVRRDLGLDRPLPQQFVSYVGRVTRGDLGTSFSQSKPVTAVIGERIGPTLLLSGTAMFISTTLGLVLGSAAARRPNGRFDLVVNTASLVGYAIPTFWLAQMAVLLLSVRLGLFPILGYTDARRQLTGIDHAADIAYHLILPATVLAVSEIALLTRVVRTGVLQQSGREYVRTARAKGLTEERVSSHARRNALLPVVTLIGARVGFLVSGAVVLEAVFSWPGLGTVITTAAQQADRNTMIGLVLVIAVSVILANLVTDLLYGWIDPRVRRL